MTEPIKILAFAGSNRKESINRKLIKAAADIAQEELKLAVTVITLKDYPLPIYDGDEEETDGAPANLAKLKQLIADHDAVLIASPEYNASVTGLLKNTLDWISRPAGENDPGKVMKEKPVALLSASPGGLGGIRALNHLRAILLNTGTLVIPAQFALSNAHQAFAEDGHLKVDSARNAITELLKQLQRIANGLKA